jgi:hypothetical protein
MPGTSGDRVTEALIAELLAFNELQTDDAPAKNALKAPLPRTCAFRPLRVLALCIKRARLCRSRAEHVVSRSKRSYGR